MAAAVETDADEYALCQKDVERIGRMLRWFESQPRSVAPEAVGNDPASKVRIAMATADATAARSGSTPGSVAIALYTKVDGAYVAIPGATYTASHIFGGSITSGMWLVVARCDGEWAVIAADCSGAA